MISDELPEQLLSYHLTVYSFNPDVAYVWGYYKSP